MTLAQAMVRTNDRPDHLPVVLDSRHEFFSEWLSKHSEVLRLWIEHFERTATQYARVDRGERVMLYTHRLFARGGIGTMARTGGRWCCPKQGEP